MKNVSLNGGDPEEAASINYANRAVLPIARRSSVGVLGRGICFPTAADCEGAAHLAVPLFRSRLLFVSLHERTCIQCRENRAVFWQVSLAFR